MKKIYRFLLGILGGIASLALILGILAIFIPLLVIGSFIATGLFIVIGIIYVLLIGFAFVWAVTKEPQKYDMNKSYSISQGREVK